MGKFLLLNKEHGISSFKCIYPLKKIFKKVGHTGTLDPFATGLLVVATDKATKFIQYLPDIKEYFFSIKFGLKTDSDDLDGKVIEENDFVPTYSDLLKIFPSFIGEVTQTPSKFSAIKIKGKRAYKLARESIVFEVPSRIVKIDDLELLSFYENIASFRVVCHKGTYVRSLASDLCNKLGVIGCVVKLHRLISNGFSLEGPSEYNLDCFLNFYEFITLEEELILKIKDGLKVFFCFSNGIYCLLDKKNFFYGLIQVQDNLVHKLCWI